MPLPRWIAQFNKRVTNRFMERLAGRFANFAVVHHAGRQSGLPYRTPVNYFEAGGRDVVVALTYGPEADWIRNIAVGPGSLEIAGHSSGIEHVEIVGRDQAWIYLPKAVRIVLRLLSVHHFAQLRLGDSITSQ